MPPVDTPPAGTPEAALADRLAGLPRVRLVAGPTPVQELPRISDALGVRILVKRDDLTGLAFGGNKVRQAEFFVGAARAAGADTFVAGGSFAQSNHARVCAAAATAAGLRAVILLRPGSGAASTTGTGNALVTELVADEVRFVEELANVPRDDRLGEVEHRRTAFEQVAAELRAAGRRPYVLVGSSTGLGVMGYLAASLELAEQRRALGLDHSTVFVSSLGVTHAGLALGAALLGERHRVVGVGYQPAPPDAAAGWVTQLIGEAAELLGIDVPAACEVVGETRFGGPEYGVASEASHEALQLAAGQEALLLDPIYTAKGFAGMLAWIREGRVPQGETVLFVHTGGLPALFAVSG
jgi:1-aminocyclopropane-1-carboxylate deaminase/D-cysteine desulfhydrase-like pyridoxal-dependent ACC family enzyme